MKEVYLLDMTAMRLRFVILETHYRQPLNFTMERLRLAERTLERWVKVIEPCMDQPPLEILEALCNDLNTPLCITRMHVFRKNGEGKKLFASMRFLGFFDGVCSPSEVKTLPEEYKDATISNSLGH